MNECCSPKPYFIHDLDTLRAIADPVRVQILEILLVKPGTVRDVAEKMGLAASKLYYHFNTLEKLGLIEVKETRMVANLLEKIYQTQVQSLDISPELLVFSPEDDNENLISIFRSTLATTIEDLSRSMHARSLQLQQGAAEQPRETMIRRDVIRVSDEKAREFLEKMRALCDEFETQASENPADQVYALTVAFYPSFYFPDSENKQDKE